MSFLDWFNRQPKVSPEPAMFIAHRETSIGMIMSAEITYSKATGRPYIRAEVAFSETDRVVTCIHRMAYTYFVLKNNLDTSKDAEEFNVAYMVGMTAKVRFDHKVQDGNRTYIEAYVLDTWRSQ